MYYYFSSEYPAVLKLNGIYYGLINDSVKAINLLDGQTFAEICPLDGKGQSVNFMLVLGGKIVNEKLSVTDLKGGFLIKALMCEQNTQFNILTQRKFDDAVITVFNDNGLKVSVETPTDFFADNFELRAQSAEIFRTDNFGVKLLAVKFNGNKTSLVAYAINQKINKIFFDHVDDFSLDENFITHKSYRDMAKHSVKTEWEYLNGKLTAKKHTVTCGKRLEVPTLHTRLLPYAFFEELLVGGNVEPFLSPSMQKNAKHLKGYLGEFIGVMPPPIFRKIEEIGLIYKVGEKDYQVNYCTVDLENHLICNVKKADD